MDESSKSLETLLQRYIMAKAPLDFSGGFEMVVAGRRYLIKILAGEVAGGYIYLKSLFSLWLWSLPLLN